MKANFCNKREHVTKRYNRTLFLYHIVCPMKYRRTIIIDEIGNESDHEHFLVQKAPTINVLEIT